MNEGEVKRKPEEEEEKPGQVVWICDSCKTFNLVPPQVESVIGRYVHIMVCKECKHIHRNIQKLGDFCRYTRHYF